MKITGLYMYSYENCHCLLLLHRIIRMKMITLCCWCYFALVSDRKYILFGITNVILFGIYQNYFVWNYYILFGIAYVEFLKDNDIMVSYS